jgi:hypothetical protein
MAEKIARKATAARKVAIMKTPVALNTPCRVFDPI